MASINIEDVSKIFGNAKSRLVFEAIKRNAVTMRRLFDLCVCANIIPKGMVAMNRRSIMNEICRQYGFKDFEDAENASLKELEVFNLPVDLNNVPTIDWSKALRNSNFQSNPKQIESANYVSNKLYKFILSQGVYCNTFNTLLNFYGFNLHNRNIFIQNKGYSSAILASKHLYWEMIMLNVSQLAFDTPRFNKENLSITLNFNELGDFDPASTNIAEIMGMFPEKLLGGRVVVDETSQKATFYFSKKLLNRIQYKKERKSFLEILGLDSTGLSNAGFAT